MISKSYNGFGDVGDSGSGPVGIEVCNQTTVAEQYACSQRNMQRWDDYYNNSGDQVGVYATNHGGVDPTTITAPPSMPTNPTGGGGSTPTAPTGSGPIPNLAFVNPNSVVGGKWTLYISGPPNAVISAVSIHNGTPNASMNFGTLSKDGYNTLTGTFGNGDVGSWSETWYVGDKVAGNISFSVSAGSSDVSSTPIGGGTPTQPAVAVGSDFFTDLIRGVTATFSPSEWVPVMTSGNLAEITGLLVVPAVAILFFGRGRR